MDVKKTGPEDRFKVKGPRLKVQGGRLKAKGARLNAHGIGQRTTGSRLVFAWRRNLFLDSLGIT
jgi:hypothetical protein